jgi:hypothetical protein
MVVLLTGLVTGSVALAQEQSQQESATDHSAHHGETGQQTDQTGQPMMGGCPMMGSMKGQGKQGMMGKGMMGAGMMQGGMGALFGARVTPMMNLSVEDVRGYLGVQLDRLGNKRLKIGDIKSDDGTITADIVTVDDSLVQRLKVNRHTGAIEYQN